jgi:hypothetical protein
MLLNFFVFIRIMVYRCQSILYKYVAHYHYFTLTDFLQTLHFVHGSQGSAGILWSIIRCFKVHGGTH